MQQVNLIPIDDALEIILMSDSPKGRELRKHLIEHIKKEAEVTPITAEEYEKLTGEKPPVVATKENT